MSHRPAGLVRVVVLGIGIVYSVLLAAAGLHLDTTSKVIVGWLPTGAAVLLLAWDLWVWRVPPLHRLTHRPRIDGLWSATLRPTDDSHIPEGGNRGPIQAYLVVTQSFWSLHVRQLTAESASDSRAFSWTRGENTAVDRLTFIYENVPAPGHRARSPRHLGSCALDTTTLSPRSIDGSYFTDRLTQGSMSLGLIDRSTSHDTFASARDHARTNASAVPG
jgi:hypothetical protein